MSRMERMAAAIARRWRCCEASILLRPEVLITLRSVGCGFFFFFFSGFWVDCGYGSVGFDLDQLVFFGSLVGFDDLATDWVGDDLA